MPKVYASKYERKMAWFRRWFRGKRAAERVTQTDLARFRGTSQASISEKLRVDGKGQTMITYEDLLCYFEVTNATPEEIVECFRI